MSDLARLRADMERDRRHGRARIIIAAMIGLLVGYAWFTLFNRPVPEGNRDVLIALVSSVTGALITIVAFYFGDSDRRKGE